MIYVIADLTVKEGARDRVLEAARPCVEATRKEKGCLSYDLHVSITDPDRMVFVERWETREDLTAHSKQPHLARWRAESDPHLVGKRIEIVHPERVETF